MKLTIVLAKYISLVFLVREKAVCVGAGHGGEMILSGVLMERGPAQQPALS